MKRGHLCQTLLVTIFIGALTTGCASSVTDPDWLENLRQAYNSILAGDEDKADQLVEIALNEARKLGGCPPPVNRMKYSHRFPSDLQLVAGAYREQGKLKKAEKLFKIAVEMNEKCNAPEVDLFGVAQLAKLYRSMKRTPEAKQLYDRILESARKREPKLTAEILIFYADDLVERKDFKGAETLYREACTYEENDRTQPLLVPIGSRMELARFYKDRGRYEDAEDVYQKLLSARDENSSWSSYVHYELGELFRAQASKAAAEKSYNLAIAGSNSWDNHRALALSGLAELEDAQGDYDQACSSYKKATQLSESISPQFLERYALFLRKHKRVDDATKVESERKTLEEFERTKRHQDWVNCFNP